jgi:hypothetical protein
MNGHLKLTKMSTNRFCLLISRLFSCSAIGVALTVPLKPRRTHARFNFAHLVDLVHIRAAINSCKKFFLVCLIELLNNEYFLSKLNKKAIRWPQKWFQNYVIKLKHLLYGSHLPNTITIIFY